MLGLPCNTIWWRRWYSEDNGG